MKTKKLIFLIFSILCLLNTKMYAQGTNCSTATVLPSKGTHADFQFQPKINVAWFSIVATSARMDIQITRTILAKDTPSVHVDSLILYSGNCKTGFKVLQYSVSRDTAYNDTMADVQILTLTPGQTYYIKATRTLKPGDESAPFFGLNQANLASAIIPSCSKSLCGPNLLVNGDFETVPSWAIPTGTPNQYGDNSYGYHATPVTAPQSSYAIASPNMRYYGATPLTNGPCAAGIYDPDRTDAYKIAKSMGPYNNNIPQSGLWFMGIDCPSDECNECSSNTQPYSCSTVLNTPNYTCTAWQQTVAVIPGQTYVFEAWIQNEDDPTSSYNVGAAGATVWMEINGGAPFFQDVIGLISYHNWTKVCYNWTAPTGVTSALIQIFGQGTSNTSGYDFSLDNLSFGATSIPITLNSATACAGSSTTLTASPAITGATYTWSTGATTTTNSITVNPLTTTTYSVTATTSTCSATATATVTVTHPTISISSTPTCLESCNGTATATLTGGTAPYTYSWSPSGQTTATATGLCAGYYTVTVTDATGCTGTGVIRIFNVGPPTVHVSSTSICAGTSGTICATGTASSYSWSTSPVLTTTCITQNPGTTTTYTVTGSNGACTATATGTITVDPTPAICLNPSTEICAGTCTNLEAACKKFPQPGVSYTWHPATGLSATTGSSITACPTVTTTYTVTATNTVTGCHATATEVVTIYPHATVTMSSTSTCSGSCVGTATANVTGGTAPYTYSWSNTQTTSTATGLCAGTYSVNVTDANGCVSTGTVKVFAQIPLAIHATSATICAGSSATICASGTFGTPPVLWSNGATTPCITVSPSSTTTYSVTTTGSLCPSVATSTVTVDPTPVICLNPSTEICPGTCTTLEAACKKLPQPGVVYTWAPATSLSATTGAAVTACPTVSTTYTVTATNTVTGCHATATEVVSVYPTPSIVMSSSLTCIGSCNGTATANVSGGTGPFTYSWSPGGQTTASATGLCPGSYTVSVTDGNGCVTKASVTVVVVRPPIVTVSSANVCSGTGATICASGNAIGYVWNTGATTACISTGPITATTTYVVTGHNLLCSASATATVTVDPAIVVTATATPTCGRTCAGTVTATATGGTGAYTYSWAPGGYNTASVSGLCHGTYTVTVTDAHGCHGTAVVTVNSLAPVFISTTSATICSGSGTGATICASGTATSYIWNPTGATTACITVNPTVSTTYTVTGSNGACSATATATVTVDPSPVVTATATPTCGKTCSGTATATTTGGTAPYTYSWAPGVQTTQTATGLCGGNYTVTVTDAHGCTGKVVVNVPYIFPPVVSVSSDTICAGGSATICASGTALTYVWNTGATTSCITVSPSVTTTYTVTASNGVNGSCSATATGTVTVIPHLTGTITSTPTCGKFCTGTATANPTGGVAPYTYSWAPVTQTTATATGLCGGNYTVTVTDAHGCTGHASVNVPYVFPPTLSVSSATICAGSSATICASGTATTFTWTPTGATTSCITVSPTVTTTYSVTGGDSASGACVATATGTVTVNPTPAVCTTDSVLVCIDHCTPLNALCNGNVLPNVTYVWSPSASISSGVDSSEAVACPQTHTIYTVTATNTVTGCTATGITNAFMFPFSNFAINGPTSIVCGSTNTYTITPNLPSPPVTYSWTAPTATPSSGTGPTATVTFNSPGSIDWIVSYPGSGIGGGCQRDISLLVTCGPTIKPRGAMENTTVTDNNVVVYPNPAGEVVNVQLELQPDQQLNMCMYNNLGEQIKCETLTENISHISTSMLPAGIYFYRITNTDGALIKSDKIMIVH